VYFGEPVLAALLRCFDRDGPPLGLFLSCTVFVELHYASRGEKWEDFRCPDLDCFLHDQIHVFRFRDGLSKAETSTQPWRQCFLQDAQPDCSTVECADLRRGFAAAAIEHDQLIARCQPQDIARMMRFRPSKSAGWPIVRREIKPVHSLL
jgi:hypothetical protein